MDQHNTPDHNFTSQCEKLTPQLGPTPVVNSDYTNNEAYKQG